jgi:hypothetical protein
MLLHLGGKRFADHKEVETDVRKRLRQQSKDFGFNAMVKRWDKCINVEHVEKYFFRVRISCVLRFLSICDPLSLVYVDWWYVEMTSMHACAPNTWGFAILGHPDTVLSPRVNFTVEVGKSNSRKVLSVDTTLQNFVIFRVRFSCDQEL